LVHTGLNKISRQISEEAWICQLYFLTPPLVYGLLRRALYAQTDRLLVSQFAELQRERTRADFSRRAVFWIDEFYEHLGIFGVVYDRAGRVVARTEQLAASSLPAPPQAGPAPAMAARQVPIIGLQRTLSARLSTASGPVTVLLMAPLDQVQSHLGRVRSVLLTALPAALVLAGAIAYGLSRRALASIEQLRRQADRITADRLSQRLPVEHPNDELGRLAGTINDMIARLEQSFDQIRRFTADASHQLRTPLAVLRTEVEVAMGRTLEPDQQHELLASVLEQCQRLSRLIDQLLLLSRGDAGRAIGPCSLVDLAAMADQVVETMRPLAEAKQQAIALRAEPGVQIWADPARLRQALYNVIDNAIKYTPAEGHVEISVEGRPVPTVTVRDDGVGIPAENLERIFDPFFTTRGDNGGTGLGLYICRYIVEKHGGQIEVESRLGEGSSFCLTLPLAHPGSERSAWRAGFEADDSLHCLG